MEKTIEAPVSFTANAVSELRKLMQAADFVPGQVLRVGVKGGGCSGMSYILAFDDAQSDDDHFFIEDIPCVMKPAHTLYLMGMEIDWGTGLDARGFLFSNPNASNTCGCGSSFAV
ncbi:MAG: HesB/IscA family protein [Sphingobacteriales bacterium]|jgi:iron-sulfur cluster assembly protein